MCTLKTSWTSFIFTILQRLDKDRYNCGLRKLQDGQRQCVLVLHRDTGTGSLIQDNYCSAGVQQLTLVIGYFATT
jgi:hypothetical protein